MTARNRQRQRGSTLLEFALLAPVLAAVLAGLVGVSLTFVRTLQADQLCRKVVKMAASGTDFDLDSTKAEVYALYGGNALRDRTAVLYVTHLVRESAGYHQAKEFAIGRVNRWKSSASAEPENVIRLETGEDAWVAEIWLDNDTVLSGITPGAIHSRSIQ